MPSEYIIFFVTGGGCAVSFRPHLVYIRYQASRHHLPRTLCGPQLQSGRFREETNLLHLLGIELRFHDYPARNLVTDLTELSRLPCMRNKRLVLKENEKNILRSYDAIQTLLSSWRQTSARIFVPRKRKCV